MPSNAANFGVSEFAPFAKSKGSIFSPPHKIRGRKNCVSQSETANALEEVICAKRKFYKEGQVLQLLINTKN